MKIIAIDTSRRRGAVSRSVETAATAAEAAGAVVERVRLAELDIRTCTGCGMCKVAGWCKIEDDLRHLALLIDSAQGVIIGTPSYFRRPEEVTSALLDRIGRYFADSGQLRLPGMSPREIAPRPVAANTRRAVIITACSAPEPLATFFGYTTGPVRHLRGALGAGGIRTIGSLAVTGTWRQAKTPEPERDTARSLGRILAGKI
ncbi:MAG: flavodoxin family protein [Clostridiales bacterium]|nr:flavodoxin family protein [Clostridiales bacterium]